MKFNDNKLLIFIKYFDIFEHDFSKNKYFLFTPGVLYRDTKVWKLRM